jgi:hypothetical protein
VTWEEDREIVAVAYEEFARALRQCDSIREAIEASQRILPAASEMMMPGGAAITRRATQAALDEAMKGHLD